MTSEREYILAQLQSVQAVTIEKFVAVDGQFSASKIAVDAALTAQKEAVSEQNKANDRAIAKIRGSSKRAARQPRAGRGRQFQSDGRQNR